MLSILVLIMGLCLGAGRVWAQQELRQVPGTNNRVVLELPTINFTRLYNEINLSRLYSRLFNSTRSKPMEEIPLEPEPVRPQQHTANRNLSPYPYLQAAQPLNAYYAHPVLPTFATQQRTLSSNVGSGKQIVNVDVPSSITPQQLLNFAYQSGQSLVQAAYNPGYGSYGPAYATGYAPGYGSGFPAGFGYRPSGPAGPGGIFVPESIIPLTAGFINSFHRDLPGVTVQAVSGNNGINWPASYLNYRRKSGQSAAVQQLLQAQLAQQAFAQAQAYNEEQGLDYAEDDDEIYGDDYDNYDDAGEYGADQQLWRKAETNTESTTKPTRNKSDKKLTNKRRKQQEKRQTKQRSKRISY